MLSGRRVWAAVIAGGSVACLHVGGDVGEVVGTSEPILKQVETGDVGEVVGAVGTCEPILKQVKTDDVGEAAGTSEPTLKCKAHHPQRHHNEVLPVTSVIYWWFFWPG